MKGQAISVRLSEPVELLVREFLHDLAARTAAALCFLADEAARLRLYPGIGFRGPEPRRAYLIGSGLDVWQALELLEEYGAERQALLDDHPLLSERALTLARAYADRFPEEIELHRRRQQRTLDELKALYPFAA
jgi:hypothetical protein